MPRMTTSTSPLLDAVERETGASPRWSILWLHGLGADGHDFAPLVPQFVRPDWPALRFVFPHAPVRAVTINGGMRMRAWYDILDFDLARRADMAGVDASVAQVEALIAREGERGVPPERVILAGFSQGGAVALAAGLRRPAPLGGLIALSTYLPSPQQAMASVTEAARRQKVFIAHGSLDPVVPFQAGLQSAGVLRQLGLDVEWHSYPVGHHVCPEEIADLAAWLGRRFAAG